MNCVVLGGNGFIGTHVTARLLEAGHVVTVFDQAEHRYLGTRSDARYVIGSLDDRELVRRALQGTDVVFHLIGTTLPKTSNDDPIFDVTSNLLSTLRLLQVCVDMGVRKVIYSSSGGTVYGLPVGIPISEEHPTSPITSYGVVKLAIEKYLGLFLHVYGLDYTVLRLANPYGPYQNPYGEQGAVSVFLQRAQTGQPITIWGDGSVVRDYTYVADVAQAFVLAASHDGARKVFNVGSGRGTTLRELLRVIAQVTGVTPLVEYLPGRAIDVPANVLDVGRAGSELGWVATTDLVHGVGITWHWISSVVIDRSGLTA